MADRTSAAIFGMLFEKLASDPTPQHVEWAKWLWEQQSSYDFSPYQMSVDAALITLGLAHRGVDPEYPNDGEVMRYEPSGD